MKLIRMEKGKNEFALVGLTMGKLMTIKHGLQIASDQHKANGITETVGDEALAIMDGMKLDKINCWGDTHVSSNGAVKKLIKVYK